MFLCLSFIVILYHLSLCLKIQGYRDAIHFLLILKAGLSTLIIKLSLASGKINYNIASFLFSCYRESRNLVSYAGYLSCSAEFPGMKLGIPVLFETPVIYAILESLLVNVHEANNFFFRICHV